MTLSKERYETDGEKANVLKDGIQKKQTFLTGNHSTLSNASSSSSSSSSSLSYHSGYVRIVSHDSILSPLSPSFYRIQNTLEAFPSNTFVSSPDSLIFPFHPLSSSFLSTITSSSPFFSILSSPSLFHSFRSLCFSSQLTKLPEFISSWNARTQEISPPLPMVAQENQREMKPQPSLKEEEEEEEEEDSSTLHGSQLLLDIGLDYWRYQFSLSSQQQLDELTCQSVQIVQMLQKGFEALKIKHSEIIFETILKRIFENLQKTKPSCNEKCLTDGLNGSHSSSSPSPSSSPSSSSSPCNNGKDDFDPSFDHQAEEEMNGSSEPQTQPGQSSCHHHHHQCKDDLFLKPNEINLVKTLQTEETRLHHQNNNTEINHPSWQQLQRISASSHCCCCTAVAKSKSSQPLPSPRWSLRISTVFLLTDLLSRLVSHWFSKNSFLSLKGKDEKKCVILLKKIQRKLKHQHISLQMAMEHIRLTAHTHSE